MKTATAGDVLHVAIELTAARAHAGSGASVTFEIGAGISVLFGSSGAGKSRTLACIAGIERPPCGRIVLGSDVWFDAAAKVSKPIHKRHVAYVFQSLALFPHMSALENVAYGIDRSLVKAARNAAAMALLERMHVGHLATRRPNTFSGGEAQRVALARAFAIKPRVLLLDEPFSALDEPLKRELWRDVGELVRAARLPTLLVTHDRIEARELGDRVLFIERGRIVGTSAAADLG